jgi:hypothetical protein
MKYCVLILLCWTATHLHASADDDTLRSCKMTAAGAVAGVTSHLYEYPFDAVRTKMIASGKPCREVCRSMYREGGVRAFYRGGLPPLMWGVGENAIVFGSYQAVKSAWLQQQGRSSDASLSPWEAAFCGAASGLLVSFFLTPTELVSRQMQARVTYKGEVFASNWQCVKANYRQGGVRRLYCGHSATMPREMLGTAAMFGSYEYLCKALTPEGKERTPSPLTLALAGTLAGVVYIGIPYPFDAVKTLMQTSPDTYPGFYATFRTLARERLLYQGLWISMASAPGSMVAFATVAALSGGSASSNHVYCN